MPAPAFTLTSSESGTEYHVFVEAPTAAKHRVPVVICLDADDQFDAAVEAYRAGHAAGEIPPLLLVGVGYGASYTRPGNRRIRDYTPTHMETENESGGADGFIAFLTGTLWSELSRRYSIRQDVRGIAGHSLGSLLIVYALFQAPPFFNRLLASAPSLWWDNRAVLCTASQVQRRGVALPAKLFLSVGENDTPSMTGDLELLEQQLAAHPFAQLEVISQRFADRDHYNVLRDAYRLGLRALFIGA